MTLRAVQQYVQVAGQEQQDGDLHVRRMYVDVLVVKSIAKEIENTLNLSSNASSIKDMPLDASSTLNLTGNVVSFKNFDMNVSDTLNLTSVSLRVKEGTPSHDLNLAHLLTHFNYVDDRKPAGNTLNLIQTVTTLSSLDPSNNLNLSQNLEYSAPLKESINHYIGFFSGTSTPYREFVEHDLGISGFLNTPLPVQHITHNISFVQELPVGYADSTLNLTQNAEYSFSLTAANEMSLSNTVGLTAIWNRVLTQNLGIGHVFTWYEITPCGKKRYTPFQGESTIVSDVTHPNHTLRDPQGSTSDGFSLYVPYLGVPTSEVVLRAPEMDNRDRNAYTRINRETRGGKLFVYSDPDWPEVRTLAVTITGLTESEIDEFQTFIQNNIGKEVGATDWEGRLWKGFITNPNEPATQDGKDKWTISFEFEGEMLEVEQPGNDDGDGMSMDLNQSVTAVIV